MFRPLLSGLGSQNLKRTSRPAAAVRHILGQKYLISTLAKKSSFDPVSAVSFSCVMLSKRNMAGGGNPLGGALPSFEDEAPLKRNADDNKMVEGEYECPFTSWILKNDRQIDPRYPHVIETEIAYQRPRHLYDDKLDRRNFGDPVHEDDELYNPWVFNWKCDDVPMSTAIFQFLLAVSPFFIIYYGCKYFEEPLIVPKTLPYARPYGYKKTQALQEE